MNADREQELVRLIRQLLIAFDSLMPGLRHIAVQDYEIINRAPLEARAALREWYGIPAIQKTPLPPKQWTRKR